MKREKRKTKKKTHKKKHLVTILCVIRLYVACIISYHFVLCNADGISHSIGTNWQYATEYDLNFNQCFTCTSTRTLFLANNILDVLTWSKQEMIPYSYAVVCDMSGFSL